MTSADHSIDLWWRSTTRRPNQSKRKAYRKKTPTEQVPAAAGSSTSTPCPSVSSTPIFSVSETESDSDTEADTSNNPLEDWDNWMEDMMM